MGRKPKLQTKKRISIRLYQSDLDKLTENRETLQAILEKIVKEYLERKKNVK